MFTLKLIFHFPDGKSESFTVEKQSVTIGRGVICDVPLPYEGFSRKHAQIDVINGEIFVTDLGSTNGVLIDGERIVPGVKKQLQTYLNLQIGPAQQVEISLDDDQGTGPIPVVNKKPDVTRSRTDLKTHRSDVTKTTRLDPSLIKKLKPAKKKEDNKAVIIGLILVMIGLGYYYQFVLNAPEVLPESDSEFVEVAPPVVVPVTEKEFLSKDVLVSLYKNAGCQQALSQWCSDARIAASQKEGAVSENRNLIIYLNMDPFINEQHSASFNQRDLNKRLEILALRRIFNSNVLRAFLRQTQFDTFQVVAGTIQDDQYAPFTAFKFTRDLDPSKIEKFTIFSLFDQILNEGKDEALVDISLLYDKLDF